MNNILEPLKIYSRSSCFFVLCSASLHFGAWVLWEAKLLLSSCFRFSQNFPQEGVWKIIKNSKIPQVPTSFWELSGAVEMQGGGERLSYSGGKMLLLATPGRGAVEIKWLGAGEDTMHKGGHFKIWLPLSLDQAAFQFLPSPDQQDKSWRVNTLRISLKFHWLGMGLPGAQRRSQSRRTTS